VEAVAACAAVTARIRRPNDVYVGERKLAGVLAEAVVGARPYVVLGIGINVGQQPGDWPSDLAGRAVSLAELGRPVARETLLAALLARLALRYAAFGTPVTVA
jgi:BirA family biotin operon repressor/biotin-[acetyl-CoA-carboxylase] ligase